MSNIKPSIVYAAILSQTGILFESGSMINMISPMIPNLIHSGYINLNVNASRQFKASNYLLNHTMQCITEDKICIMSCAHAELPARLCFDFLMQLQGEYNKKQSDHLFFMQMKKLIEIYSDPTRDKIYNVKMQVDQIRDIMKENIEKACRRGDNLKEIEESTDDLLRSTEVWHRSANTLKWNEIWKNWMCYIWLAVGFTITVSISIAFLIAFLN